MSSYLEIRHLSQSFSFQQEETKVLEDISFTLEEGEFLCILGPSGCGKTTLLRCLAGFLKPSGGKILIGGNLVDNPGRHCAMVFQTFDQLLPWKTVLGNVTYPLLNDKKQKYTKKEAKDLAVKYLEMVGLSRNFDYYPHQLSGGMKQRVAIARALALKPSLILMDEPFASLDADSRTILQREILRIWRESGVTVLFVTHSIIESIALATKMLVLGKNSEGIRLFMDNPVVAGAGGMRTPQSANYPECWTKLSDMVRGGAIDPTKEREHAQASNDS